MAHRIGSLFNVNAMVGRGAYEEPDYPTPASLLAHMDYLGIDRSLVSHVEARDLNPTWGNRRLLKEIEASGSAARLIPAFVISPSCYYENGVLDFLNAQLASGRVRALRIHPEIGRFPILLLERLLAELARWNPVILWDCGAGSEENIRDFAKLATAFPDMAFVFTRKGMFGYGSLIDQMARHNNLYVDVVYMAGYVNLLIEEFGPERILFGINVKVHNGAAVAALAHYQITDEQRELIAHGNIERLLDLNPLARKLASEPELLQRKPLWRRFRKGLPLEGVNVVDAHGHIGPISLGWYLREMTFEEQIDSMTRQMARMGVRRTVVSAINALFSNALDGNVLCEQMLKGHADRFSGYLVFHPLYGQELVPELDRFFQRGFFLGFKILPVYWKIPVSDPRFQPVWDYADRHRLPILIHTWEDSCNAPAMLTDIARRHPNATFLLGHSGGTTRGRIEAEELALACPNVFLEFCGTFVSTRPFEQSMQLVGNDRIVFGSDSWGHDLAWELGRYLSMPVPDEDLIPGLGENFERCLRGPYDANTITR